MFSPISEKMQLQVETLQQHIIQALEKEDHKAFSKESWKRPGGGGGLSMVLENGSTFEKAGVNTSAVFGKIEEKSLPLFTTLLKNQNFPTENLEKAYFFATGVSLVIHPHNPFVPTTHANYRYFELALPNKKLWWFGGGADLTPYYFVEEDAILFHQIQKTACDKTDPAYYPLFKTHCDSYFHLPHRQETRGIGGIFFDYLHDKSPEILQIFSNNCALAFLEAYTNIVQKRKTTPYSERAKTWQNFRRGRYAEFNLLYDRGTQFGLQTQGRIESILMSLPPIVQWPYQDLQAEEPGEKALINIISNTPRQWV